MSGTLRGFLPCVALLALMPGLVQAQKPKAAAPQPRAAAVDGLEVVGLQIIKPRPPAPVKDDEESPGGMSMMMGNMMGSEGTTLTFALSRDDKTIIAFDAKASKLTSATDDKATDLTKASANQANRAQMRFGMSGDSPLSVTLQPGGHSASINAHLPQTPAKGATRILLKGQLAFVCGSGEKTVEQKNLSLKDGKITVGPIPITFGESEGGFAPPNLGGDDKPSTMVTLNHTKPLGLIKKLTFLDASGKVIPHHGAGQMSTGFGGQMSYSTILRLDGKVDRVSVKLAYFDKTETLTIPVNVEASVGF